MNAQQLGHHLASLMPQPKSIEVDLDTFFNAIESIVTFNYDEDKAGIQDVSIRIRNGHVMFKGVELILINRS